MIFFLIILPSRSNRTNNIYKVVYILQNVHFRIYKVNEINYDSIKYMVLDRDMFN